MDTQRPLTTGGWFARLVATAALLFVTLPTVPADAGTAVLALQGSGTVDQGVVQWSGSATGVHGTSPRVLVPVTGSFGYGGSLAVGSATGTMSIDGHSCGFNSTSVGAATVATFGGGCTGGAVMTFVPTTPPGSEPSSGVVVGAGALTH